MFVERKIQATMPTEREAEVDDEGLVEEARSDDRDAVEEWDRDRRRRPQGRIRRAELRSLEDARDPFAGKGDRDPDDDLVEPTPDAEHDHEERRERPGSHPGQIAEPHRVAVIGADEADVGAEQHHALQPDVEHAGPLGDGLTQGGEHERKPGEQAARHHARPEQPCDDLAGDQRGQGACLRIGDLKERLRPGLT